MRSDADRCPIILSMCRTFIFSRFIKENGLFNFHYCKFTYPCISELLITFCSALLHLQLIKMRENIALTKYQFFAPFGTFKHALNTFLIDHYVKLIPEGIHLLIN